MANNGILGKFQERLWRIRMARSGKKKKKNKDDIDRPITGRGFVFVKKGIADNKKVRNVKPDNQVRVNVPKGFVIDDNNKRKDTDIKIVPPNVDVRIIPPKDIDVRINKGISSDKKDDKKNSNTIKVAIPKGVVLDDVNEKVKDKSNDKVKEDKNSNIEVGKSNGIDKEFNVDEKKIIIDNNNDLLDKKEVIIGLDDEERRKELERLEEDILDKIRNSFKDKIDELDVLESELYLISVEKDNAIIKEKINAIKEKIDEFVKELNKIIELHNTYKRNYYIDNILTIDDGNVINDLVDYRTLVNSLGDEREFVKKYKRFVELSLLYDKLIRISNDVDRIKEETNEKDREIEARDSKYEEIALKIIKNGDISKGCIDEINRQNAYFADLMSKINIINREEYTTYHLRGIDELIGMSLRYVGLMMVSPLSGIIPGIAMQTILTGRLVRNARDRLHMQAVQHVHYDAIDYDSELSQKLTDINYTSELIDDTLNDVKSLKEDFMRIYDSRVPGYDDTMEKINKVEEMLISNQNKVLKIRDRINESKKMNNEKLVRVRDMNNSN